MVTLESDFVDRVVKSCFDLYNKLPKTGKPTEEEWTVLSCVVKYDSEDKDNNIEVVSLGTGSKCIGATKMSPKGDIMNDSHAEIFARRGFLRFLYNNIERTLSNQQSIFTFHHGKFKLKEHINFIFYSSQMPCGDASIIPKCNDDEQYGHLLQSNKRKAEQSESELKKSKLIDDIHRTGAKCLPVSKQDPKEQGTNYHLLGQVRTKPGRGDRTLSVSCSDKIAKWIHLGIQGGLLHMLCGPIYIKYFIFGAGVPYSKDTLKRALLYRNNVESKLEIMPEFYQASLIFESIRKEKKIKPASGSIVWIKSDNLILEVAVQGKKLGVTKKNATSLSSSLCISKHNLYKTFLSILYKRKDLKQAILTEEDLSSVSYNEMKKKSTKYYEEWYKVKNFFFKCWTVKPDMWDFCVTLSKS